MATILFVDDEPAVLNALRRALVDMDWNCLFAASASEGLAIAGRELISVVVTDNTMPGMLGVDFLEKLKVTSPDTVRILLTGNTEFVTALDAINRSEAFRFIPKPWQDTKLKTVIAEGIQRFELIREMRSGDEARYLALAKTVELKDPYTLGHCERVAEYACMLAKNHGFIRLDDDKPQAWVHPS